MDGLTIRSAKHADLKPVLKLLRGASLPTEGVEALVDRGTADFVVAERDGTIVGAAALEIAGADALLRSVVVRADGRSAGIGRAMVTRLLADADRRFEGVYLLTTTAGDWFPRFGFSRVERQSVPKAIAETWEFKTGCGETAIAMVRTGEHRSRKG